MRSMTRSRLAAVDGYWYLSDAADAALSDALATDGRRRWDPRRDRPSLATLRGRAKAYSGKYERSRAALIRRAGVSVRELYDSAGRRVWIVTLPTEPLSAAVAVDRRARTLRVRTHEEG